MASPGWPTACVASNDQPCWAANARTGRSTIAAGCLRTLR
jgi:hypothetical protein